MGITAQTDVMFVLRTSAKLSASWVYIVLHVTLCSQPANVQTYRCTTVSCLLQMYCNNKLGQDGVFKAAVASAD